MIHVVSVALVIVDLAKVDAMFLVCEFVTPLAIAVLKIK